MAPSDMNLKTIWMHPKWFWQKNCRKKAGQVEPFLSKSESGGRWFFFSNLGGDDSVRRGGGTHSSPEFLLFVLAKRRENTCIREDSVNCDEVDQFRKFECLKWCQEGWKHFCNPVIFWLNFVQGTVIRITQPSPREGARSALIHTVNTEK